jgi:solute carrier family 25 uncoupling protein 8/9
VRSSILTAAQCATYDEIKRMIKRYAGLQDGLPLHLASSMAAGLVTTTITNPIDVIKTRMFVGERSVLLVHQGGRCPVRSLLFNPPSLPK